MSDLARLGIWDELAIRDGLSWYLAVAENRRPAKFRIAATVATQLDLATSGEEALDRVRPPDADICCTLAGDPGRRQFHADNFCDPASHKYREKYAEIARRPTRAELHDSWQRARELGLKFEITTFERDNVLDMPALLEMSR